MLGAREDDHRRSLRATEDLGEQRRLAAVRHWIDRVRQGRRGRDLAALEGYGIAHGLARKPLARPRVPVASWICSACSRVGTMINARTAPRGPLISRSRIGKTKAAFLPVPVWATPTTSLPWSSVGIARRWMGVGSV